MNTILVVDDDQSILKTVSAALTARNFVCVLAPTGMKAKGLLATNDIDVVVLDLGLPDIDGVDLVRAIRSTSNVPVIVLSADGSDSRKVLALELGADDYVTKPFSNTELVARVRVALRHRVTLTPEPTTLSLVVGDLVIEPAEHRCRVTGREVDLTPKEFAMLVTLARRPGSLVTHRTILNEVWGHGYGTETHYLRVYASQLRKKLGDDPGTPTIRAEPGVGYRLELDAT